MSVRTMAKVWEHSQHGGTDLLMLLAIADFADDQGNAYPSVPTLAEKCRMKPRNAQVILGSLRKSGELQVKPNEGPRGTNLYRITLVSQGVHSNAPLQSTAPLHSSAQRGAKECAEGVHSNAPEPSLNHQEPPIRAKRSRRSSAEQTFDDWYAEQIARSAKFHEAFEEGGLHAYLEKVGLSDEFRVVAWKWFKQKHKDSPKKQKSWQQTFLNYVRNNYGRLWFLDDDQTWRLTSVGKQVAIEHGLDPQMQSGKNRGWTEVYV